jgi:NAD(P)-dependent dehydrogenase (short-subunit alcohol dehydrogenase family)
MQGKVVVITGATSGIGQVAAERLASLGARILIVARDPARAQDTLARLRAAGPGVDHGGFLADLSQLSEMRRVGADIAAQEPQIDVLVNNAGGFYGEREITGDGWERTFALNHMAYYVLTHALRRPLLSTPGARVINTSSEAHRAARPLFTDLQSLHGFNGAQAYCRSKLYNILFTRELARRWSSTGVSVNTFHPGVIASGLGRESGGLMYWVFQVMRPFAATPERGARTLVQLASDAEGQLHTGQYFVRSRPTEPTAAARNEEAALRLWQESARLAGLDADTGWQLQALTGDVATAMSAGPGLSQVS